MTQNESRGEVAKESAAAVEAACQSVGVSFGHLDYLQRKGNTHVRPLGELIQVGHMDTENTFRLPVAAARLSLFERHTLFLPLP